MHLLYIIYGLTGTGKTERAVKLAQKIGGYCLSADSRQWYHGSPVGSNQPQGKMVAPKGIWREIIKEKKYLEVSGIPYLACNTWGKKRPTTVMDFKKYVFDILRRQQKYAPELTPIIVGGTGLYIKSILQPETINPLDKPDQKLRRTLQNMNLVQLQNKLKKIDLNLFKNLADPKNPHRLIRAIEKSLAPKKLMTQNSELRTYNSFTPILLYHQKNLTLNALTLILNKRTQDMLKNGWLKEVQTLLATNPSHPLLTGIGYQVIADFLHKKISRADMVTKINTAQRQYAKRQKTFFKNQL